MSDPALSARTQDSSPPPPPELGDPPRGRAAECWAVDAEGTRRNRPVAGVAVGDGVEDSGEGGVGVGVG